MRDGRGEAKETQNQDQIKHNWKHVRCIKCSARFFDTDNLNGRIEIVCPKCRYKSELYFVTEDENYVRIMTKRKYMEYCEGSGTTAFAKQ